MCFLRKTDLRTIFHPSQDTHSPPPFQRQLGKEAGQGVSPGATFIVPCSFSKIRDFAAAAQAPFPKIQRSLLPVIPFLGLCPQLVGTGNSISVTSSVFVQLRVKGPAIPANSCSHWDRSSSHLPAASPLGCVQFMNSSGPLTLESPVL